MIQDDKLWVIICATILGAMSFFFPEEQGKITQLVVTGLFGVAVGRATNK